MIPARPSKAELQAAYGRTVPDLVRPGLAVLLPRLAEAYAELRQAAVRAG